MHPRHPLREALLEGDPSDARAVPAISAGVTAAPSPAASSSGVCSSISRSFSSFVPDVRSRFAFAVAFLCALAVSAYWLQLTIRSKWLFEQQHPTQVVSYDTVASLPALFGLQFLFSASVFPPRWTYFRRVTTVIPAPQPSVPPLIRCTDLLIELLTYKSGDVPMTSTFCDALTQSGQPVLDAANAPAGELDGASASSLPLSDWALQFTPGIDGIGVLCFQIDVLLNHTAMLSAGFDEPLVFLVASLSSSAMLAVHEVVAAGLTHSPSDPAVLAITPRDDYLLVSSLPFSTVTGLQSTTTRTVQVDGQSDLGYDYLLTGTTALAPSRIQANWIKLLNGTHNATERAELQTIKDDPTSLYASAELCVQPRTYVVQEIAFFHLYGWSSFLSDVGGFVSILSLVFVALFPLTVRVTKARDFLPIWMVKRCKEKSHDQSAEEEGGAVELRGMQQQRSMEP